MPAGLLAFPGDLQARLGVDTWTGAETERAAALLADASALVRSYTRQTISVATSTDTLDATDDEYLFLPERPVISVASVTNAGIPANGWSISGDSLYSPYGWRGYWQPITVPPTITVTYTHGYADIPDDIVRVVCSLAQISWVNPSAVRSYTLGAQSVTLAGESVGTGILSAADKAVLDRYRRQRHNVVLRARAL